MTGRYRDRHAAGQELARLLGGYADRRDAIVLGLPRGGVPVAFEVARALRLPLDIELVRKLGVPGLAELAMGAIAAGGVRFLNEDVIQAHHVPPAAVTASEGRELVRRESRYRGDRPPPRIDGRVVILVDDGLATGATMRTAIVATRAQAASRVVVAVPVGAWEICAAIERMADEVVCALTPDPFDAVGHWYDDFSATSDDEVVALLRRAANAREPGWSSDDPA